MYSGSWARKVAVCSLILSLSLAAVPAQASKDPGFQSLRETSWWTQVQRNIAQQEYEITWQEDVPGGGAFHAANRAQNLRCYFRDSGVEVIPRMGDGGWCWGFRLAGIGRGGSWRALDQAEPAASGRLVEYVRPLVIEWYDNRQEGIEQGFVISEAPRGNVRPSAQVMESGRPGAGPMGDRWHGEAQVVLEGLISGNVEPRLDESGEHISFLHNGREVLRYGDLKVVDARGVELASRLELEGDVLSIVIDGESEYPLYVDPLLTSPSWTAEGNAPWAYFGWSLAGAGDVNGDGYSDIIVGAYYHYDPPAVGGRAYVYHGSASGLSTTADWIVEGSQSDYWLGYSVASAGDVNDDGYSDVIVGDPGYDNGEDNEGRALVYHGSATGLSTTPDWVVEGDTLGIHLGHSVAGAGDVNNDGYSDVIVSAPWFSNGEVEEGVAYVYHGSVSGLSTTPAWRVESQQDACGFGYSVASAGDVNGDGYDDVIVGANDYDNGEEDEGRVYVYHGSAWDGSVLPSGVYFYEIRTDGLVAQKKMILAR